MPNNLGTTVNTPSTTAWLDPTSGTFDGPYGGTDRPDKAFRDLPAKLSAGERVLWQGAPHWQDIANQVFHVRIVAIYFALYGVYQALSVTNDGGTLGQAFFASVTTAALALPAVGILVGIAWLVQRTTLYTITSKRILLGVGIALPKTFNIPFDHIDNVALLTHRNGTGNISLKLTKRTKIAWLVLWPHLRPWHLSHPEPTLRGLPNAAHVAEQLSAALKAHNEKAAANQSVSVAAAPSTTQASSPPRSAAKAAAPLPVRMTLILMVCCAAFIAVNQLSKGDAVEPPARLAVKSMTIDFQREEGGVIAVLDQLSGEVITNVQPGNDGIIRGALRSFANGRNAASLPLSEPYQLERLDTGEIMLRDASTNISVPIDAFGPYGPGATLDLIKLMKDELP